MRQIRYVLSCIRVSGKAQIDRTGLPRQIAGNAIICREHNLVVLPGDDYRFEGLSGATVEQFPLYREMLKRLEDPKIAGIVFLEVSRLFRPEFVDNLGMTKPFREFGKLMFYEDGVLDLRKERDQGIFANEALKAGAARKRIMTNTQWGRNERRKQGDCKTDPIPAGVAFISLPRQAEEQVKGYFVYTPESLRVKEAFSRVLAGAGASQAEIARDLNFSNSAHLRQNLRSKWWIGEKESKNVRVGQTMRNDGSKYDGKRTPRPDPVNVKANFNGAPPLISRETYDAVQVILDETNKTWKKAKEYTGEKLELFLGRGILYCECGKKMYAKPFTKKGKVTLYYMCSSCANRGVPCKDDTGKKRPFLKQSVVDRNLRIFAIYKMTSDLFLDTLQPEQPKANRAEIQKQIDKLKRKEKAHHAMIGADEVIDQDTLMKLMKETKAMISGLETQLKTQPVPVVLNRAALRKGFLDFGKKPMAEQKALIEKTFSKIFVDEDGDVNAAPGLFAPVIRLRFPA